MNIIEKLLNKSLLKNQKERWDRLAKEDAKYYIHSIRRNQDEAGFRESGREHVRELITGDPVLIKGLGSFDKLEILEIGCGIGRMTEFMADNFKKVHACDISREMIASARKRLGKLSNVSLYEIDGVKLPLADGSIDFAFSYIVYQHVNSYRAIKNSFQEVHRVLKNQGWFKVQIRGRPTAKDKWWTGFHFNDKTVNRLLKYSGFALHKMEGKGEKYLWLYLQKSEPQ